MNRTGQAKRPHGQIRQSQLITTFGPGAMLDLPNYSVLIGGLDYWSPLGDAIAEPRLAAKLCWLLGVLSIQLHLPPANQDDPTAPPTGVTPWQFPEWFITQDVNLSEDQDHVRSRLLVHRSTLTSGKFIDEHRKRRSVVPVRFVRACRAGHIGDLDWYAYVHGGNTPCHRRMWLDEQGTSGDLAEVSVRCECGEKRSMALAVIVQNRALGHCDGARPWLGPYTKEPCGEPSRLLIRTASNAYFPQVMSVISLPDRDDTVTAAVDTVYLPGTGPSHRLLLILLCKPLLSYRRCPWKNEQPSRHWLSHHLAFIKTGQEPKHFDNLKGFIVLPKRWIVEHLFRHPLSSTLSIYRNLRHN